LLNDYGLDYDAILINGDSYSASDGDKVYGNFLGEMLNIPVKNIARAGSNNQRIVRSTIEEINNFKQQYKNPLVLIGWSFIRRLEVWYYGNHPKVLRRIPDRSDAVEEHLQPRLITLDILLKEKEATLEQKCLINEDLFVHKQLVDFYTNLFMLAHFLESMSVEYFFFSAAKNTEIPTNSFPYIDNLQQVKWCQQNKNMYKLHDFCVLDWAKVNDKDCKPTGHLSLAGHEQFAKLMINMIKESTC